MIRLLIVAIRLYQRLVSPQFPPTCRFYPTCSSYAILVLQQYGPVIGLARTARRLLRCHPFSSGGYDPVT